MCITSDSEEVCETSLNDISYSSHPIHFNDLQILTPQLFLDVSQLEVEVDHVRHT